MEAELHRKKHRFGKPENGEELEVPSISEGDWPTLHQLAKVMEPIEEISMVLEGQLLGNCVLRLSDFHRKSVALIDLLALSLLVPLVCFDLGLLSP